MEQYVVPALLTIILSLSSWAWLTIIYRLEANEKRTRALAVAMMFFLTSHNPPPPTHVIRALTEAMK